MADKNMTGRERQLYRDAAYIEKRAKARIAELRRKGVENLSAAEVSELRGLDNRGPALLRAHFNFGRRR